MERDSGKAGARSFCNGCEGNEQEAVLLHLAIEGALNILTPPWYLLKPSCFSRECPCSILQSCCMFHHYMQQVVCKYPLHLSNPAFSMCPSPIPLLFLLCHRCCGLQQAEYQLA